MDNLNGTWETKNREPVAGYDTLYRQARNAEYNSSLLQTITTAKFALCGRC